MAYYEKTLEVLHALTEEGEKAYRDLLERKGDEILYRHAHPVKYFLKKIASAFS